MWTAEGVFTCTHRQSRDIKQYVIEAAEVHSEDVARLLWKRVFWFLDCYADVRWLGRVFSNRNGIWGNTMCGVPAVNRFGYQGDQSA